MQIRSVLTSNVSVLSVTLLQDWIPGYLLFWGFRFQGLSRTFARTFQGSF